MLVSDLLIHLVAVISIIVRLKYLYNAVKQGEKGKIKFELFFIIVIIVIWALIYFFAPIHEK